MVSATPLRRLRHNLGHHYWIHVITDPEESSYPIEYRCTFPGCPRGEWQGLM